jgi:Winged helix DNA-binding domain
MPDRHTAQVLRYRARVSHLDEKLPLRSIAKAAWGGLQDSVPRGGVISLHARVEGAKPDAWEHPSLVQIWFRGGADYIVPRRDVGIFTLGCLPRDRDRARALERLADEIRRVTEGKTLLVREVAERIGHRSAGDPLHPRASSTTGRVHIRWDASNIWLIPVERPSIDPEDARRELARRFIHWYGPTTRQRLASWTGVKPADATETWKAIEPELAEVRTGRFMLEADVEALEHAEPVEGVRLLPQDDPFTKFDHDLLVTDERLRLRALPRTGQSPGYIPGSILVDGEIVGAWQRQQRKVTLHPFSKLSARVREAIEREALSMPIAGPTEPSVIWD